MNNTLAETLRSFLRTDIVAFTFRKLDGTIRHAVGTRNLCLVCTQIGETIPLPKNKRSNPNAYYDIERKDWRAFSEGSIISIDKVYLDGIGFDGVPPIEETPKTERTPKEMVEIPITKDDRDFGNFFDTLPTGFEFVVGKDISVDDFARLVAKYVVEELGNKLK